MSHASHHLELPAIPASIRDRIVSHHRGFDITEHLQALEAEHPGVLDAMVRTIGMLESYSGVEATSVDYDEDDVLFPVTIWARTVFAGEDRFRHVLVLESKADEILGQYPELVLVAIL